jgi:aspartokinase/homoserine dehydrogenase 1
MKFGRSLTSDAEHLARIMHVIRQEHEAWERLAVVVSAKSGVTDELNHAIDLARSEGNVGYRRAIAKLRADHQALIDQLFADRVDEPIRRHLMAQIDQRLFDVMIVCDRASNGPEAAPRDRDAAMAVGEQIMVHIVTALLRKEGLNVVQVEAASLIITDNSHQNAHPLTDLIDDRVERILRPILDDGVIPVIAGFIGATRSGAITTLGRGGSDYTATILGAALRADEVWMWTGVDGIMSADPELVPGARVIPSLTYEEVGELSYFGARVLHPEAVEPLAQRGIPLRVRNPKNLDHAGTLIQHEAEPSSTMLKAVTAIDGLCLTLSRQPFDMVEFMGQVRYAVGNAAAGPVIATQSYHRATVVFVVPTSVGPSAVDIVAQRLASALPRWEIQPVKVIAAIGAARALTDVDPIVYANGPGNRRLFAVAPEDVTRVVRQLHKLTESGAQQRSSQVWPR